MCNIQAAFFDRNGSGILGSPCSVTSGELANIDGEAVVTFTSGEAGKVVRCHIAMNTPSGSGELLAGQITVPSGGGTLSFIVGMSNFVNAYGIGRYSITNVNIFDMNAGVDLCNGSPSGGFCQSINITAPSCPTPSLVMTI